MVLAVRALHSLFSVFFLSCLSYVYYAALARKRGPILVAASGALLVEGAVLAANGGDCPLGRVHHRFGDDRTFFELFLAPRAAFRGPASPPKVRQALPLY
ncbi:MAG: hypothetical protein WD379_08910 [Dehalococcoidia bacterium]